MVLLGACVVFTCAQFLNEIDIVNPYDLQDDYYDTPYMPRHFFNPYRSPRGGGSGGFWYYYGPVRGHGWARGGYGGGYGGHGGGYGHGGGHGGGYGHGGGHGLYGGGKIFLSTNVMSFLFVKSNIGSKKLMNCFPLFQVMVEGMEEDMAEVRNQ